MRPINGHDIERNPRSSTQTRALGSRCVHLFACLLLNHVDVGENSTARDRPPLGENRNNATIEMMVQLECASIVLEGVGEQCERKLCRTGIAFVPRKAVWGMFMQIEARIERTLGFALARTVTRPGCSPE
jgi:hypothetical protein